MRSQLQPRDYTLRVLQCMRVLMRDPAHRALFVELGGAEVLVRLFADLAHEHCAHPHADFASEMLVETLSILKRFAALEHLCPNSNAANAHDPHAVSPADALRLQRGLVALLSTREALVLQCVLVAMQQFVLLAPHLAAIGQLGCAEILLRILTDYEPSFRALAAELLEALLRERTFFQDVVLHDGAAVFLSAVHTEDPSVQLSLLRCLERLAAQPDAAHEIRQIGGINALVVLLGHARVTHAAACAICAVLVELALDDEAAHQIRKANGVYVLGRLLVNEPNASALATPSSQPPKPSPQPSPQQLAAVPPSVSSLLLPPAAAPPAAAPPLPLPEIATAPTGPPSAAPPAAADGSGGLLRESPPLAPAAGEGLAPLTPRPSRPGLPPPPQPVLVSDSYGASSSAEATPTALAPAPPSVLSGPSSAVEPPTLPDFGLAVHVFRALRFVFSTERNRKIFRRLFPPDLFAAFIDVGHYTRTLSQYAPLAQHVGRLSADARARMQEALADINVIKGPAKHYIRDYAVQELLGKGAFGNVYQVKKDTGETLYAMKQLALDAVAEAASSGADGGRSTAENPTSYLKREVDILTVLQHPNIIHYYESFKFKESLYIVMELVEGATLLDHITSLTEKKQCMPLERIWSLFTQMCLALRYIHKEKNVVHRDLTPSNIMIAADGVVKLADFGLARQKMGTNSVMESVVGTVLYQCPEIIQHEQYGEKADIWSLGCVLYQMAMLRPPFEGGNPLIVANNIVEGTFPPLTAETYPPDGLLSIVVNRLLEPEPTRRPDIDIVAALISPVLMAELGRVSKAEHTLRAEVHTEREWRQQQEKEASRNKKAVHQLFARHNLESRGRATAGGRCIASGPPPAGSSGAAHAGGALGSGSLMPSGASHEPSPLRRSMPSRSPMLSISPSRIKEITDPMTRVLNQLHKILFICQLPPSTEGELSAERGLIEKYKRELFSHRNHYRGRNLKDELHKLMHGAHEMIDLAFRAPVVDISDATNVNSVSARQAQQRISYEDLQKQIEAVLEVTGYYALQERDGGGGGSEAGAGAPSADLVGAPAIERAVSMPDRLSLTKTARMNLPGKMNLPPVQRPPDRAP